MTGGLANLALTSMTFDLGGSNSVLDKWHPLDLTLVIKWDTETLNCDFKGHISCGAKTSSK